MDGWVFFVFFYGQIICSSSAPSLLIPPPLNMPLYFICLSLIRSHLILIILHRCLNLGCSCLSAGSQGRFKAACFVLTISGLYSLKGTLVIVFADFSLLEHNDVFTDCVSITLTIWKAIPLNQICLHCLVMHASFHFETLELCEYPFFFPPVEFSFLHYYRLLIDLLWMWYVTHLRNVCVWERERVSVWLRPTWACFRSMYGDLRSVRTLSLQCLVDLSSTRDLYNSFRIRKA